jgi:hypothetical protein
VKTNVLSRQKYIGISSQLSVANDIMQPGAGFLLPGQVHHHHTTGCVLPQERKANIATIPSAEAKTATIYRRISSTTYKLRVHFSDTAQETMNDKILHLIQHAAVTNAADCGTMNIPQMTQPLEGSSL